jgi:hypothetical protein
METTTRAISRLAAMALLLGATGAVAHGDAQHPTARKPI